MTSIPHAFGELIQREFNLHTDDRVIDIGCGSGNLTFLLKEYSLNVDGLDASTAFLRLARKRDKCRSINWLTQRVEEFDFGNHKYRLVISFEAFHLFQQRDKLVRNIWQGLIDGGVFCVGWVAFHWETLLFHIIVDVCNVKRFDRVA